MRRLINLLAIACLALPLGVPLPAAAQNQPVSPPAAPPAAYSAQPAPYAPGVVLIGLAPDQDAALSLAGASAAAASLQGVLADLGVQQVEPVFGPGVGQSAAGLSPAAPEALSRIYRLRLPAGADVLQAVARLQADPAIAYAEPDYVAHLIATPTDPLYPDQWGLATINASAAWDVVTGTPDVSIAVIDSGLDLTHPDLANQLWTNPGETPGNSLDDDNNGYIDDMHGANIYAGNVDLTDTTGHGTQVAGIIAAQTNNAEGVAGVCWQCRLMVVKVTQPGGIANYSDIAAGIAYAAQKGADVINLSLGGLTDSSTLRAAITAAAPTAVIVAGAGNNDSAALFYPAAYEAVLAVAGTTISDTKVATSNYGAWVDLTAPGEMITTTTDGGSYGLASGTSLAAPFVAGAAGLLRSQHPEWSPALVQAQLLQTADDIDGANPSYAGLLGHGRLDAAAAVTTNPTPLVQYADYAVNGVAHTTLGTGASVSLTVLLRNDWGPAAVVTGTLVSGSSQVTVTQATANWGAIASGATVANDAGPLHLTVGAGASGLTVPFTLTVRADGVPSVVTFTATTAQQVLNVSGTIVTNTVWTSDRVYLATNHVIVGVGVTLTIEPGTVVKFAAGKTLAINGTLIADGTAAEPIRFTSNAANPAPGDWGTTGLVDSGSIVFFETTVPAQYDANGQYLSGSILRHAIVEYGTSVTVHAAPYIDHNLIWKNGASHGALWILSDSWLDLAAPHVTHNQIIDNGAVAIFHDFRPALIQQNLIAGNTNSIVLMPTGDGTTTVISNTIIDNETSFGSTIAVSHVGAFAQLEFSGNNLFANPTPYDFSLVDASHPITVTYNFWGSTSQSAIESRFDIGLSEPVPVFVPFLTAPNPDAPAFLYQLELSPASPVGIQRVTFNLTFSAPMDQSIDPTVTFGVNAPYADWAVADNAQWTSETTWQATFDITSLIARATHTLSVSGARGLDGLTIPTDTRFAFEVDYAGEITDQTAPLLSQVAATGSDTDPGFVQAHWTALDDGTALQSPALTASSAVVRYRYALGSAPGATDVVNWTNTTSTGLIRNIPGLVAGHTYWVNVQAQNAGGLWSQLSQASFVAGLQTHWWSYLPMILQN